MEEITRYRLDSKEIKEIRNIQSEYTLVGSIKPKKNHRVFEYNFETKEIKEAIYLEANITYSLDGNHIKKRKIVKNKGCIYVSALNKKNALKRINKY
jgi:hypothetical protein